VSKKIRLFSVGLIVFVVVLVAFAGTALAYTSGLHSNVVGSKHDLNVGDNVCEECHVPHFAQSTQFLWATTPTPIDSPTGSSSDIKALCYSCHDGTGGTSVGQYTAFNTAVEQHKTTSKTNYGKTGRDCDLCHDPHEDTSQRPNFIRYQRLNSTRQITTLGADMCVSCHTANVEGGTDTREHPTPQHNHPTGPLAQAGHAQPPLNPVTAMVVYDPTSQWGTRLFDPTVTNKPVLGTGPTATVNCESCHAPHGAYNETLNSMTIVDGALCTNCHN
jgi:predicted CXXCH cytochrome family protein